jgi:periplasmic protein CpxP/Spy
MKLVKVFVLLMVIGFIAIGCGRRKHWDSEKVANKIVKHVSSELKLDDSQKKQLEEIKVGYLERKKKGRESKKENHNLLVAEIKKDSIDKKQVSEIVSKMDKQRNETREWMIDQLIAFHKTLSAEQKVKLVELMEKFHSKRSHHSKD